MYKTEGLPAFWKGILPPILVETPKRAVKVNTYCLIHKSAKKNLRIYLHLYLQKLFLFLFIKTLSFLLVFYI